MDWTLQNYSWLCVTKTTENQCDNTGNPLIPFWVIIRNIVYALVALFVLGTAFILIITRGQSITVMKFLPRFVFIVVLITFSFSLVQFVYLIGDIIQDFFLKSEGQYISTKDLLYIGFKYETFTGFRRIGLDFEESAFISLLLVRLTAITYYVMTGILLIRKIILWFFIIISPVFPLLLFYRPIRNTAKIWIGEFFRWLFYAPLFAIFLHGLVVTWRAGIPLAFDFSKVGSVVYPTAINILLGGPGQTLRIDNSVNIRDTFALYIVALLMLWVVILLPFLLLKIFLDYLATLSLDNNVVFKQFVNRSFGFLNPSKGIPPPAPPPSPGMYQPAGAARALPFLKGAALKPVEIKATVQASVRESADILRLANLSIPNMRDVARFEASMISRDIVRKNEAVSFHSSLQKIANPAFVPTIAEREKFSSVRQKLLEQKQKGNPIASSVLSASQVEITSSAQKTVQSRQEQITHLSKVLSAIANPQAAMPHEQQKFAKIKEKLIEEKQKGNPLAESILETQEKLAKGANEDQKTQMESHLLDQLLDEEKKGNVIFSDLLPQSPAAPKVGREAGLPSVNRVQQVSVDDYEEVRKLWTENYQTIEPPKALSGNQIERHEWIKNDIDKINHAIELLTSADPEKANEGMGMVSNILPFLLIGGFSKTEVIAYLKAKMQAGKSVLEELARKEEEEETMVSARTQKTQTPQEMAAEEQILRPLDEKEINSSSDNS
ncbi:MAG: hypothetical protein Q8P08_02840, partial [bacterium]|nr:hypothetical protein [bacterium]